MNRNGRDYNGLKVAHTNAQGLKTKFNELKDYLIDEDLDVCAITETWLSEEINDSEFLPDGYQVFRKDRRLDFFPEGCYSSVDRGGVALIIKNNLKPRRCIENDPKAELIWCDFEVAPGKVTTIGCCYRAEKGRDHSLQLICESIDKVTNPNIILLGDFNFPRINWNNESTEDCLSRAFVDCLQRNYLTQVNFSPTRKLNILDLVIVSNKDSVHKVKITEPLGNSDHDTVSIDLIVPTKPINRVKRKIMLYSKGKFDDMNNDIAQMDWDTKLGVRSLEESWSIFKTTYEELCAKHIPSKTIKAGQRRNPPWLDTYDVRRKRKNKAELWKNYQKTMLTSDRIIFDKANKDYMSAVYKSQLNHERSLTEELKENPKRFYNHVRNFTKTDTTTEYLINDDGKQVTDKEMIAEEFSNFFASVMTTCEPLKGNLPINTPKPNEVFHDIDISEAKIRKKLETLKLHKSSGPDNVHVNVLRRCPAISKPLAILFRRSMENGYLPQDWRDANITPIHKKGSRAHAKNFRPVSLTSQVAKLMEKLILDSLKEFIEANKIISCEQHGFQSGCSCVTQLLECFNDWITNVDEKIGTDIIYLDFAKAFDRISHSHLLFKLEHYGIGGKMLSWIKSFLTDRRQRVVSQQAFSGWKNIISGVPQGALLSPILFLLFVNDLPEAVESKVKMFADDTKLYREIVGTEDSAKLQQDLNHLAAWSKTWSMSFNASKCAVLKVRNKSNYVYTMNGTEIAQETEQRDLGVIVSDDLKPRKHVESICSKVNRKTGLTKRCFKSREPDMIKSIYTSVSRPVLEYASPIWSPWLQKEISLIENTQRRALALANSEIHLESLESRRERAQLIETYKILNKNYKINPEELFERSQGRTRGHSFKLFKKRARLDIKKNFFPVKIVNTWNRLPADVVEAPSIGCFKKRLDEHRSSSVTC